MLKPEFNTKLKPIDAALNTHLLALGNTGKGKSASIIIPTTCELLASRNLQNESPSVLVIDAKNEYEEFISEFITDAETLVVLNGSGTRFNPFEIKANQHLVEKVMPLYDNSDGTDTNHGGQNQIFAAKGRATMISLLKLDQAYYEKTGRSIFSDVLQVLESLEVEEISIKDVTDLDIAKLSAIEPEPSNLKELFYVESGFYTEVKKVLKSLKIYTNYFESFKAFIDETLVVDDLSSRFGGVNKAITIAIFLAEFEGVCSKLYSFFNPYKSTKDRMLEQWYYNVSYFASLFTLALDETVCNYCDLDPFSVDDNKTRQEGSFKLLPFWDRGGIVLLKMNPAKNSDEGFDFVGRNLKSMFFKYTFSRENIDRPVAYICDEFHRFLTTDRESGEQHYLDRCRAYNAVCVLATQSIQSLKEAAKSQTGKDETDAIDILLNNTANKYFFGTTDPKTQDYLSQLVPGSGVAHMPKVSQVRTLATLERGQCYEFSSDGDWGIKSINLDEVNNRKHELMALMEQEREAGLESSPSVSFH